MPVLLLLSALATLSAQTPITVTTRYNGLYFFVDSASFNSAQQFNWAPGSTHTINVLSPQYSCGGKYTFASWSSGGPQNQTITTPSSPTAYIANYAVEYQLTLTSTPANGGAVSVNAFSPDSFYPEAAILQLTANPAPGYVFAGWSGEYSGTANPLSVQMNSFRIVTAVFTRIGVPSVTVSTNPPGYSVIVDGSTVTTPHTFEWTAGSTHSLSAGPPQQAGDTTRYVFSHWSDGGSAIHTVTASPLPTVYTANLATQYKLTPTVSPPSAGSILITPETENGWVPQLAVVRLTAVPAPGFRLDRWSGDALTLDNPALLTMNEGHSVTANFTTTSTCAASFSSAGSSIAAIGDVARTEVLAAANCQWTASSDSPWVAIPESSSTGNGIVRFSVEPNPYYSTRRANLRLSSGATYSIAQTGYSCLLSLNSPSLTAPSTLTTTNLPVSGPSICQWDAVPSSNWITVNPAQGYGASTLALALAANSGPPRTASLSLAGQSLKILQKGAATPQVFTDVLPSNLFFDYIHLLNQNILGAGCTATTYCPNEPTTRARMAVLIIRSLYPSDTFTYSTTPYFSDVPAAHPQFKYIQKMNELRITDGCTTTTYCPSDNVTRGQMAVFLVRSRLGLNAAQTFPFPPSTLFTDVPGIYPFFPYIQKLREMGITAGCTTTEYCPNDTTTQGQMAVFLIRSFFTP